MPDVNSFTQNTVCKNMSERSYGSSQKLHKSNFYKHCTYGSSNAPFLAFFWTFWNLQRLLQVLNYLKGKLYGVREIVIGSSVWNHCQTELQG